MKIKEIRIQNFRSLVDVSIPLDDTTVLLGENNAGKTAVLDAIRFMLSASANRRGATFDEYDIHLPHAEADPRHSEGIILSALFEESLEDKWDDEGTELSDVINIDIVSGIRSLRLRVSYRYDSQKKTYEIITEFLNEAGHVHSAKAARQAFLILLRYVPIFYLSTLRDPDHEFSNRSQFWSKLLAMLELPENKRQGLQQQMDTLNQGMMAADPRIQRIRDTLSQAGDIVAAGSGNVTDIRALPLKADELLTQAEVVLRGRGNNAFFPLSRHGQGVQSLSVLFLFQAFVEHLLETTYEKASHPLLTLEEPEAHLHPQAARELWKKVAELRGQKVVTTHSPYFAQHVPLYHLRILRRKGAATTIHYLPTYASEIVPDRPDLLAFIQKNPSLYSYRKKQSDGELIVKRRMAPDDIKALKACSFAKEPDIKTKLDTLIEKANALIVEDDLHKIETFARRTRGELLFSRCWLLAEGHSELTLLPVFATMLKIPLDAKGISVIAYQDNGSAGAFAQLGRAFGIPWFMFYDDDRGGHDHLKTVLNYGFSQDECDRRALPLPGGEGTTLEPFLVKEFPAELHEIASEMGASFKYAKDDLKHSNELLDFFSKKKTSLATRLAAKLNGAGPERVPEFFKNILQRCAEAADD